MRELDASLARRVIFLTGDTLNEELTEFLRATANPYLAKPVQLRELHATLHRLLERPIHQGTLFPADD